MTNLALAWNILGVVFMAIIFGAFVGLIIKIQNEEAKRKKAEQDLRDVLLKNAINSEPLDKLINANNSARDNKS